MRRKRSAAAEHLVLREAAVAKNIIQVDMELFDQFLFAGMPIRIVVRRPSPVSRMLRRCRRCRRCTCTATPDLHV